uniref:Formin FH3 domain-containing protein n=1 Tax=Panagrolaimus superbus TaxID=310955 RepID=A0A914Z920_9BILA
MTDIRMVLNNEGIIYFFKTIERKCKRLEDILRSADQSNTNITKKLSNMLMCIKYLYECVSCLYEIFRTAPGYRSFINPKNSFVVPLLSLLVTLNDAYDFIRDNSNSPSSDINDIDHSRLNILKLLVPLPVYQADEYQDHELLTFFLGSLDYVAAFKNRNRLECIVVCLQSENLKVVENSLNLINTIINNVGSENHEHVDRIIIRNEFLNAGFSKSLDNLRQLSERYEEISQPLTSFDELDNADFDSLEDTFREK